VKPNGIPNETVVNIQEGQGPGGVWVGVCWWLGRRRELRREVICPKRFL